MKRGLLYSWISCLLLLATASLTPAFGQGMSLDLGKTTEFRYLKLVGNTGDGKIQDQIKIFPEYCAKNVGTSMYFDIHDSFVYQMQAGKFAIINVEYYDTTAGTKIEVHYDAIGDANKLGGEIVTAGTGKWVSQRFFLDDAYFGNREANGADFKLVCPSGTMYINGVSVVPFDAYIDYYSNTANLDSADSYGMVYKEKDGGDSKFHYQMVDGEPCAVSNLKSQYMYCAIDDSLALAGNHPYVFVSVVYYDDNPLNRMRLQYDGANAAYVSTPYRNQAGWHNYRTYTFEVSDAFFNNRENGGSDMRVQFELEGFKVKQITVGILSQKPLPNPTNIGNWTAYKALESPVVDGSLKEWSWNRETKTAFTVNGAGDRTDEFFRTWFLNPENVPVAEVGEPNVTAPATAGLWDPKDLTGSVRMLWDDQNIYVAAVVNDNVHDVTGTSWKEKDGIGLFFDVSHTGAVTPLPIKDDPTYTDGESFIFLPASNTDLGIWKHSTSQDGEALPTSVKKSVVVTDSGYVLEASIPLSLLKGSYNWTPGKGGKDDFNPLFGWTINDADGVGATSGRLMYGAHSDDDEFWGTLTMAPIPLLDKGIMIDFGNPNYENLVYQVEKGGDGAVDIVEKEGKNCALVKNGYIYLAVNDTAIGLVKHPRVTVSVEYFDSQDAGTFNIQYDGASGAYTDLPSVTVGDTKTWKVAIFNIPDAKFANSENGGADLRIHCTTNNLYVNQVRFAVSDLWIDLGTQNQIWGITPSNLGGDGARKATTVGGVDCIMNDRATATNANYLYHQIADSLIVNGNHKDVWVSFEYYDTTSTGEIGLNYDGVSTQWSNGVGNVFILGSNQWKIHTFHLEDALFNNRENGASDFRVGLQGGTAMFINRIMIGSVDGIATPLGVHAESNIPNVFALDQNYPNPFNPSTTIRFSVPVAGLTTLKVYNILGQEVATLVNEVKTPGYYSVQWNASAMSSGIYFTRLTQNDNVRVDKAILMK